MARAPKILIAVVIALVLHGLLLRHAVAPRVHGLTPLNGNQGETAETFAEAPPVETVEAADHGDDARVVGWAEPKTPAAEAKPSLEKIAIAETPAMPEPAAVKSVPPVSKPAPQVRAKVEPAKANEWNGPPVKTPPAKTAEFSKPPIKVEPKVPVGPSAPKPGSKTMPKASEAASGQAVMSKAARALAAASQKSAAKAGENASEKSTGVPVPADSSYANRVRQHLAKFAGALPPGANGEARVQFVVQPDGHVSDVHLVKVSGNAGLDGVALGLPGKAQPLPLPGPVPQRLEVPVQAVAAAP